MDSLPRLLIFAGLALVLIGGLVYVWSWLFPNFRPGSLPGDNRIERGGTTVYIPLATMLIASLLLSGILWFIGARRR